MQKLRIGVLAALLAALLAACSQPAQIPQGDSPTAAPATGQGYPAPASGTAPAGDSSAYPAPASSAAYPSPEAPANDEPLVVPQPSSNEVGVVSGTLIRIKDDGSREPVGIGALYLGGLLADEGGTEGMVSVDKTTDPQAQINSRGEFVFVDVPAGRYGLMYDNYRNMILLNDPETSGAFIIEVAGGETKDLGELGYPLPE